MPKMTHQPEGLTASYLRSIIEYDSSTGRMTWKVYRGGRVTAGTKAGRVRRDGYIQIKIHHKMYLAHRLAWLYVHGQWPPDFIDHKNGDKADNRFANLREATRSQNGANRGAQTNNSCGLKGVHKCRWRAGSAWKAQIYITEDGVKKIKYLGLFKSREEAHAAYLAEAAALYGEFARP